MGLNCKASKPVWKVDPCGFLLGAKRVQRIQSLQCQVVALHQLLALWICCSKPPQALPPAAAAGCFWCIFPSLPLPIVFWWQLFTPCQGRCSFPSTPFCLQDNSGLYAQLLCDPNTSITKAFNTYLPWSNKQRSPGGLTVPWGWFSVCFLI